MADPTSAAAESPPAAEISIPGAPGSSDPGAEGALAFFNPDAVPYALAVIVGTIVLVRVLQSVAGKAAERAMRHRLAIKQGVTLVGFGTWGVTGVVVVSALFELSAQAIFALSGTLAVAGGFLLKDIAESTVAGVSILITRPFQVGDRISFGGFYGEVQDIGLRTVRLITLDDNLVSIPSSKFLNEPVASANAGSLDCMVVVPFYIAPQADHQRAREIVRDAVLSSRFLYLGKPISVLVSMRLSEGAGAHVELTAKAYVYDARHEKTFASDITDRVLQSFRSDGIEFAARAA